MHIKELELAVSIVEGAGFELAAEVQWVVSPDDLPNLGPSTLVHGPNGRTYVLHGGPDSYGAQADDSWPVVAIAVLPVPEGHLHAQLRRELEARKPQLAPPHVVEAKRILRLPWSWRIRDSLLDEAYEGTLEDNMWE
jgi:hypothetical protein